MPAFGFAALAAAGCAADPLVAFVDVPGVDLQDEWGGGGRVRADGRTGRIELVAQLDRPAVWAARLAVEGGRGTR